MGRADESGASNRSNLGPTIPAPCVETRTSSNESTAKAASSRGLGRGEFNSAAATADESGVFSLAFGNPSGRRGAGSGRATRDVKAACTTLGLCGVVTSVITELRAMGLECWTDASTNLDCISALIVAFCARDPTLRGANRTPITQAENNATRPCVALKRAARVATLGHAISMSRAFCPCTAVDLNLIIQTSTATIFAPAPNFSCHISASTISSKCSKGPSWGARAGCRVGLFLPTT